MRSRAYENRMRRQELQTIALRNEVRSIMGGDPIENPYSSSSSEPVEQDTARRELLRQMDFDDCTPMGATDTIG